MRVCDSIERRGKRLKVASELAAKSSRALNIFRAQAVDFHKRAENAQLSRNLFIDSREIALKRGCREVISGKIKEEEMDCEFEFDSANDDHCAPRFFDGS